MGLRQMLLCMATLTGLVHSANSQGAALLALSENPVYSGETVMITCNYGAYNLLSSVTIDAFDGSEKKGSLSCKGASTSTNGTGIFSGQVFLQACRGSSNPSNHFSVSMVVSPLLELDYNCTVAVVLENVAITTLTSVTTSLIVDDLQIKPNPATFNESHNAIVKCESLRGTPTSVLQLTVRSPNGSAITGSGNGSTSLLLPQPLVDWHNAIARCTVINRIYPNISTTSLISVNHINCISSRNGALEEAAHGTLNCSTYVSGHPIDSFSWSVSTEVSVGNSSLLNGPVFTVMHGKFGSVNCTVTNSVTNQRAIVLFKMNNIHSVVTAETSYRYVPHCFVTTLTAVEHLYTQVVDSTSSLSDQYWIVCTVFGSSVIVIGLAIGIAYKRRSLNHGKTGVILKSKTSSVIRQSEKTEVFQTERSDANRSLSPTEELHYESLRPSESDEQPYMQLQSHAGSVNWNASALGCQTGRTGVINTERSYADSSHLPAEESQYETLRSLQGDEQT